MAAAVLVAAAAAVLAAVEVAEEVVVVAAEEEVAAAAEEEVVVVEEAAAAEAAEAAVEAAAVEAVALVVAQAPQWPQAPCQQPILHSLRRAHHKPQHRRQSMSQVVSRVPRPRAHAEATQATGPPLQAGVAPPPAGATCLDCPRAHRTAACMARSSISSSSTGCRA